MLNTEPLQVSPALLPRQDRLPNTSSLLRHPQPPSSWFLKTVCVLKVPLQMLPLSRHDEYASRIRFTFSQGCQSPQTLSADTQKTRASSPWFSKNFHSLANVRRNNSTAVLLTHTFLTVWIH